MQNNSKYYFLNKKGSNLPNIRMVPKAGLEPARDLTPAGF